MNNAQKLLVGIISAFITNKSFKTNKNIKWKAILKEADCHNLKALLFYAVKKLNIEVCVDDSIITNWQKDMLLTGIVQMRHMWQVGKVLSEFHQAGIPVIALKGLVLRALYPHPELRTMSDADILVHKDDMECATELLLKLGYYEAGTTPAHIHFEHEAYLPLEIHWKLTDERYIDTACGFEDDVWKNAVPVKISNTQSMMLSYEDQAVHLCLHMANHITSSGFGLRQLCDFVLLIELKGDTINWYSFYEKVKLYKIEQFALSVFTVCKQLFDIDIPAGLGCSSFNNSQYQINMLINDIFSGGVFGKRHLARMYGNDIACHTGSNGQNSTLSQLRLFVSILFPPQKLLSSKYKYAAKQPFLIPIAWVHHFFCGMSNKNFYLYEKVKFFFCSVSISKKRVKLLRWLGLQ